MQKSFSSSSLLLLLLCSSTVSTNEAIAEESPPVLRLNRTAQSGVESHIAYERSWDKQCNAQRSEVTITREPEHGQVSVVLGVSTIPASTPRFGSTGACAGKEITGNELVYKSKPNFRGVDVVGYDVVYGSGRKGSTLITITVK